MICLRFCHLSVLSFPRIRNYFMRNEWLIFRDKTNTTLKNAWCYLAFIRECREKHILGDPGAVSRVGRKGATKGFKHGWKSRWVPTLTGPFPNGQANAGSWLGTKNALYYCVLCPIGEQHLLSSFREFLHNSYWLDHGLSGSCTKEMHAVRNLSVWYKHYISTYW